MSDQPPTDDQLVRLHSRIDEMQTLMREMLDAMTYDRKNSKPGILPRLDKLEADAANVKRLTLSSWGMDMGTYVLKVLLAALAMYLAASAKRGIVLDLSGHAVSNVIDVVAAQPGTHVASHE